MIEASPENIRKALKDDQAATCVALAKRWLKVHPDDLWITHDYATMLYQMARYDDALAVYNDAIGRFPDFRWGIYNQLGHLHRYRGALAEAEFWYQKAIDEDADEAGGYIFLGAVQARQGKLREAEHTHWLATQCHSGCIDEAYHNLGLVMRGQGRLADTQACFAKVIELCPDYPDAIEAMNDVTMALAIDEDELTSRST